MEVKYIEISMRSSSKIPSLEMRDNGSMPKAYIKNTDKNITLFLNELKMF